MTLIKFACSAIADIESDARQALSEDDMRIVAIPISSDVLREYEVFPALKDCAEYLQTIMSSNISSTLDEQIAALRQASRDSRCQRFAILASAIAACYLPPGYPLLCERLLILDGRDRRVAERLSSHLYRRAIRHAADSLPEDNRPVTRLSTGKLKRSRSFD